MKIIFSNRKEELKETKSITKLQYNDSIISLSEKELNFIKGGEGEDGTEGSDIDFG
ncbi:MAG: hypothetical protein HC831_11575 [Chloroflexia bacterium]|nr:hypothetical protein [Chloroflexia bacterium]